jgi:hypothetical protein
MSDLRGSMNLSGSAATIAARSFWGDAHHRLVTGKRDKDNLPDLELDLVAHHHLVGPG